MLAILEKLNLFDHSHKKRIVWNTGPLNRNLYVVLKFTKQPNTPGMISKKNIAFREGNKQFARDFVLIWMKQRLIWFNLQRDGTRNGLSNIKETFAENLLLQMSVLHQSMSIFQGWSLKFIWWLGKINVKKKYLMCQIQ